MGGGGRGGGVAYGWRRHGLWTTEHTQQEATDWTFWAVEQLLKDDPRHGHVEGSID